MKQGFGEINIFKNILDMFTFSKNQTIHACLRTKIWQFFLNKINNLATQSWKKILAFAS